MKWYVLVNDKRTGQSVEGDSHEQALGRARGQMPPGMRPATQVEPMTEPGKCHDNRRYSQSGPVLSADDL